MMPAMGRPIVKKTMNGKTIANKRRIVSSLTVSLSLNGDVICFGGYKAANTNKHAFKSPLLNQLFVNCDELQFRPAKGSF